MSAFFFRYPSVCSHPDNVFPVGRPQVVIKKRDIEKLKITKDGAFFEGKEVHGLCHVKVDVAPTFYPFLQINENGKSFCALCARCVKNKNESVCKCKQKRKGLISVWTIPELVQAVKNGDKIVEIYEALIYNQASAFLKEFLDVLSSYKIRHSKFTETCPVKLKKICDEINQTMNFTDEELILTPEKLVYNEGQKDFYKLWANTILGKFSQDNERMFHEIVTNQQELNRWFNDPKFTVHEVLPIGSVVQLGIQPNRSLTKPNLSTQVVIGSYVTAYARIEMYRSLQPLWKDGVLLCYSDTDSAILKVPKNTRLKLPFGNSYRQWKDELPQGATMQEYYGLGPKSYGYSYHHNGKLESVVKCKGFSLRAKNSVKVSDLKKMVEKRIRGEESVKTVPQFHIRIDKKKRKLYNKYSVKRLSSNIVSKRVKVLYESKLLPVGYDLKMKNDPLCYDVKK